MSKKTKYIHKIVEEFQDDLSQHITIVGLNKAQRKHEKAIAVLLDSEQKENSLYEEEERETVAEYKQKLIKRLGKPITTKKLKEFSSNPSYRYAYKQGWNDFRHRVLDEVEAVIKEDE